jgi:hypothetical protein
MVIDMNETKLTTLAQLDAIGIDSTAKGLLSSCRHRA